VAAQIRFNTCIDLKLKSFAAAVVLAAISRTFLPLPLCTPRRAEVNARLHPVAKLLWRAHADFHNTLWR
jgi:hypothetical protein